MSSKSPSLDSASHLDAHMPGAFPSAPSATITTQQTSLSQLLYQRRAEYTRPSAVRIKVATWNTAAQKGPEQDVGAWFVQAKGVQEANQASLPPGGDIGIYVLGLQEVVDLASPTEALRPYTDPSVAKKWKDALEAALPTGYQLVAEQQLMGLWLVIYASPLVFPQIKNVSTTSVGTGLMGYMGNKGAVTARIVLGETTRLVFINSHFAAGTDKAALERRNWDAAQVHSRTRFDPIVDFVGTPHSQAEILGEEEFAFWFGDLNYRLQGMPGDDVRRLLTIHTRDMPISPPDGNPSRPTPYHDDVPLPPDLDPASVQTTIASLLPHDELRQQMASGKAFHDGWQEGPIRFLPSYKYDIGTVGVFDSSEKRRCPSWCDRILYRTLAAKQRYDTKVKEQEEARKRDEEMKAKGMGTEGDDDILFDYDPDTDGDNNVNFDDDQDYQEDPEPQSVTTKDGFSDEILLESYTTHMRVLSSDHKPLDAVFALKYDAVVPELKAAIHSEIVRELDRQENEGRPSITVVVERATGSSSTSDQDKTDSTYEGVDFGDVKFAKSKRRVITIANTGRVPAVFGFADHPVDQNQAAGPLPDWLQVSFDREPDKSDKAVHGDIHQRFTLEPADVINAELKLKVESIEAVRSFNEGTTTIEDVLVLRVENGRDHFLPLRAQWLQSALARSVDKLVKIPEGGIRKLQHQVPVRDEVKWSVPFPIYRLTSGIEDMIERTLAEWDMTKKEDERAPWRDNAGWPFVMPHGAFCEGSAGHEEELANLYDALDRDAPFAQAFQLETRSKERVEMLAEVLITFLSSVTDGVITKSLWEKLEEGIVSRERTRQSLQPDDEKMWALEILATASNHNACFLLLLSFIQNIVGQITDISKSKSTTPRTSTDLPASPRVHVRRRTLSKVPEIATRQLIIRNYAVVFADVIFRTKQEGNVREKDKAVRKERMVKFMELFLGSGDEDLA